MQTIKDVTSSFNLYAVCVPCERMERLPTDVLCRTLGPATRLDEIRRRLRCKRCGERSGDMRIVYVGPCHSAAGFHYR